MTEQRLDLGLTAPAAGCGGDSCACGAPDAASASAAPDVRADLGVTGMTCSHCVGAVTKEISAIDGVTGVDIDLVAGGTSRVRVHADAPVAEEAVRAAVAEAGYAVAD